MKRIQKWMGGAACALAVLIAGCASDGNSRSTGQVIDDTVILTKSKAALVNDPVVSSRGIDVDVARGVVSLNGAVNSNVESQKAEDIVRGIDGVRSVQNNLVIRGEATGSAPGTTVEKSGDSDVKVETTIKKD